MKTLTLKDLNPLNSILKMINKLLSKLKGVLKIKVLKLKAYGNKKLIKYTIIFKVVKKLIKTLNN